MARFKQYLTIDLEDENGEIDFGTSMDAFNEFLERIQIDRGWEILSIQAEGTFRHITYQTKTEDNDK